MTRIVLLYVSILLVFLPNIIDSTRYFVNPRNKGNSTDGLEWGTAFLRIEDAAEACAANGESSNQIWLIGNFTYIPDTTSRDSCFSFPRGTNVIGGFEGTERTTDMRPTPGTVKYDRYITVISGDIGIPGDNSDNCYHVITYDRKLDIDRVTIQDGNANYKGDYGYFNQPNARHRYGGALVTLDSTQKTELRLHQVIFLNNTAYNGGALWFISNPNTPTNATIVDCRFENNKAIVGEYEGGYGGAIYFYHLARVTIIDTDFVDNYASLRGGALYQDYGGILSVSGSTFESNVADGYGGAIFSEDRNSQTNGTHPRIIDTLFVNNTAKIYGGAIAWFNHVEGTLEMVEFERNHADNKGGAIALVDSTLNSTDITYDNNTALNDADTNELYKEAEFLFTEQENNPNIATDLEYMARLYENYDSNSEIASAADINPSHKQTDIICRVDASNSASSPDGDSWKTAYGDLQGCLNRLKNIGGEVWVMAGTYVPTEVPEWKQRAGMNAPHQRSFIFYRNIAVYGGFDGKEQNREQRDFNSNPTYLSGKMVMDNGQILYAQQLVMAEDDALIDGFIFKDAGTTSINTRRRLKNSIDVQTVLSSTYTNNGIGVFSNSTNMTIVNSVFYKLFTTGKGGAVYCIGQEGDSADEIYKSPTFVNVAFIGNRANGRGGAITADVNCDFECNYCLFEYNSCAKKGGAIYLDFDSNPKIYNSEFNNNYAYESGGCIAADGKSYVVSTNTKYRDNWAKWEGGCLYSGSGVSQNIEQGFELNAFKFPLNEIFENNQIMENHVGYPDIYGWPYSTISYANVSSAPTPEPTKQPTKSPIRATPNFLIFIIDDIEYTKEWNETYSMGPGVDLTYKPNEDHIAYLDISTPNINSFMSESVVFPRSYSNPKCSPSRYSLLTGRNVVRSAYGVDKARRTTDGSVGMSVTVPFSRIWGDDAIYNIPKVLQASKHYPYYTGMIGKWHLMTSDDNGKNVGCEKLTNGMNTTIYSKCTRIVKQQGFDFVDGYYHSNIDEHAYGKYSHNPEWMVQQAQDFVDLSIRNNAPFFLYFSTTLCHAPSVMDALVNHTYFETPNGVLNNKNAPKNTGMRTRSDIYNQVISEAAAKGFDQTETNRLASNIWIDDTFGALITYLERKRIYDNTFIILVNDHGMGAKGYLMEHGVRIMQSVRYPELFGTSGYIMPHDFIVDTTDVASIIFDVAKIDLPTEFPDYIIDSKNWLNDVQQHINATDNGLTIDYDVNPPDCCTDRIIDVYNSHTIISKDWKYIFRKTDATESSAAESLYPSILDMEQLYDLELDPDEQFNLVDMIGNETDIDIKDELFRMRIKMMDYIYDVSCLADDLMDCVVPEIDYIPEWSAWRPPTPPPTFEGYTCDGIKEYTHSWSGLKRWKENLYGDQYREQAEEGWAIHEREYSNLSITDPLPCGNLSDIEYLYNFTKVKQKLSLSMMICCNGTFGPNYLLPVGFSGNEVYDAHIWDDITDGKGPFGLKEVVVVNVCLILLIICIIGLYIHRNKNKYEGKINKLMNFITQQNQMTNELAARSNRQSQIIQQMQGRMRAPSISSHTHGGAGSNIELATKPHEMIVRYQSSNESHSQPSSRRNSFSSLNGSSAGHHQQQQFQPPLPAQSSLSQQQSLNLGAIDPNNTDLNEIPVLGLGYQGMPEKHSRSASSQNSQVKHQIIYSKGSLNELHDKQSNESHHGEKVTK